MKFMLPKFVLAPAVLAAAALAANSAAAETTIKVPFSFTAQGKVCPAGEYTVNRDSDNASFITLRHKGYSENFSWVVGPGQPDPTDSKVALKFDQVGNAHILQSVQYGAVITSRLDKQSLRQVEQESTRLSGGR